MTRSLKLLHRAKRRQNNNLIKRIYMLNTFFEVKLEKDFGYCLVSVLSYSGYGMGDLHAIQPMNLFSKQPLAVTNEEIAALDQVAAPILCLSKPPIRGSNKWKTLGQLEDGKEMELPICIDDATRRFRVVSDWNKIEWEVIYNLERERINYHKFCQVAHLSDWGMATVAHVLKNLTMLWMRLEREDIRLHYDTEAENTSEQFLYKRVMNMRLYSEIAKEDRNRVLEASCDDVTH